ncbi:hypothetical protein PCASD_24584 [Puccinia coronata f. sp. avenae]|uniref:Uncharacterized protein n=1 Tax=Puccinia coronata f. sp. avenae TaxID=200324 RepID=A0A2N5RYC2_9BASI|nr:hypothetical protein PCASD_24584 [Puccinia coronata f. sp. avenae]
MGVDKYARVIRAYTRFCPQRPQRKKHGFPRTHAGSAAGGEESPWSALRPHTGGVSLPCTGQGCKTSPGRRETAGSALSAPASSLSYRPRISEAWQPYRLPHFRGGLRQEIAQPGGIDSPPSPPNPHSGRLGRRPSRVSSGPA